jgi:F-type H+-transporting ATPase subunit epsilon
MAQLTIEIVTPERRVLTAAADEVRAPGAQGGFGVRLNHAPFMTALEPGRLTLVDGGREQHFAIGGGFLQVADNRVLVLADSAEAQAEIDVDRAKRALAEATERLRGLRDDDHAHALESGRARRAAARLQVAGR